MLHGKRGAFLRHRLMGGFGGYFIQGVWALGSGSGRGLPVELRNGPPRTRMCPHPFFEATPPGAAPGPPVKTGARVRHFRGCKKC